MHHLTDAQEQILVQRASDDPDAFQALYQHYVRRIYGYVASRIDHQQDVEDVVAEVFLRVVRNLDQLRNRQHTTFAAWLFVITRHAITDHYRRNGHAARQIPLDAAEPLAALEPSPDHVVSTNEETVRLHQMIRALPGRKREVITLRYYGGLRNHEIAVVLNIGEKTVSAYLSRALNELQEKYNTIPSAGQP